MNQEPITTRIRSIRQDIDRLVMLVTMLETADITRNPEYYEYVSTNAALLSEQITCRLRHLVYDTTPTRKPEYLSAAGRLHGIAIDFTDGILEVTIPGLFPKRKQRMSSEFLADSLHIALFDYIQAYRIPCFRECVICFTHIYDETLGLRRIRDYDNLEQKQVLDVIGSFVLTDDSGQFCDVFHTTEIGESDCVRIAIMEKDRFTQWLETCRKP